MGKLDRFSNEFNVDAYRNDEGYYWGYMLLKRKRFSIAVYFSAFKKWLKRGFTTENKARRRVEDEIR